MRTDEEVKKLLRPSEYDGIVGVVTGALADYDSEDLYPVAAKRVHSKSLRAHIRNDHMVARAQELAMEEERIRYTPVRGKPLLSVADALSVAFKKLDNNRRPRLSKTKQSQAFMEQVRLPMELPPEATNLIAGYVPDKFDAGYEAYLVCPGPTQNHWEIHLPVDHTSDFFASSPQPEASVPTKSRVTIRSQESDNGSTDETGTDATRNPTV